MREIKFRAWKDGVLIPDCYVGTNLFGEFGVVKDQYERTKLIYPDSVEQFTGLHDANGVDIYEGDVVECRNGFGCYCGDFIVSWHNDAYFFIYSQDSEDGYGMDEFGSQGVTVIGNIHQNPELLSED